LIGLWEFDETNGATTVADTSDVTPKVPLTVTLVGGAVMFAGGMMTLTGTSVVASAAAPHLNGDVINSHAVTLEAWVMPSMDDQGTVAAPVVVAGLSPNTGSRNISLMQAGKRWVARVRTTADGNGGPDLQSTTDITVNVMTHLVVVADATQRILYVDGKADAIDPTPAAPLSWDPAYKMTLGNEPVQGRQWAGTFALVAMYKQALSSALVTMNHAAGPSGQ
jgi:hypothetical protein